MKMVDIRIEEDKQDKRYEKDHCPHCELRDWVVRGHGKYRCGWGQISNEFCTTKDWEKCPLNDKVKS
jgi:hypothetical protein